MDITAGFGVGVASCFPASAVRPFMYITAVVIEIVVSDGPRDGMGRATVQTRDETGFLQLSSRGLARPRETPQLKTRTSHSQANNTRVPSESPSKGASILIVLSAP